MTAADNRWNSRQLWKHPFPTVDASDTANVVGSSARRSTIDRDVIGCRPEELE